MNGFLSHFVFYLLSFYIYYSAPVLCCVVLIFHLSFLMASCSDIEKWPQQNSPGSSPWCELHLCSPPHMSRPLRDICRRCFLHMSNTVTSVTTFFCQDLFPLGSQKYSPCTPSPHTWKNLSGVISAAAVVVWIPAGFALQHRQGPHIHFLKSHYATKCILQHSGSAETLWMWCFEYGWALHSFCDSQTSLGEFR